MMAILGVLFAVVYMAVFYGGTAISVALTPLGAQTVQDLADHMHQQVGLLIDQIGEARLLDFIRTAQEIKGLLTPPKLNL